MATILKLLPITTHRTEERYLHVSISVTSQNLASQTISQLTAAGDQKKKKQGIKPLRWVDEDDGIEQNT